MWLRAARVALPLVWLLGLALGACAPSAGSSPASTPDGPSGLPRVLATETFLADMAQNVAGSRLKVASLLPTGVDPHSYEPTPGDVTRLAQSTVLIENGGGLETYLGRLVQNAGGERLTITAARGLTSRTAREGEAAQTPGANQDAGDPHFWMDPTKAITYVMNIRDGLAQADPAGTAVYDANAEAYIQKLRELDGWISEQVQQVPAERRLLVTNHETLGYYADRYGFRIVGTVIPSVSSEAAPSAQQLAHLVDTVKATGAKAIFLEAGTNDQLAKQVAQETGAKVITDLYTHYVSGPEGPAPTYEAMLKHDTQVIVDALK